MNKNKVKSYAVMGLGTFGKNAALTLAEQGMEVMAVDINDENVRNIMPYVTIALQLDVTKENALKGLGLEKIDCAIIAIGEDLEASVLATILVKEMGVPLVITKAENELQKTILKKVGADRVLIPEKDMAVRFANNLVGNYLDYFHLSDTVCMVEVVIRKEWVGKSLAELDFRNTYHLNIVAIRRGEEIIFSAPDLIFKEDDIIIAVGTNENIEML